MNTPIKSVDVKKWLKRKRTQRHSNINSISRPSPPPPPAVTSSASSSADFSGITTDEEVDLAKSLILLSQAGNLKDQEDAGTHSDSPTSPPPPSTKIEKIEKLERTDKLMCYRVAEPKPEPEPENTAQPTEYPCKTCGRVFHSFQALGGHRASHKKPKLSTDDFQAQSPIDAGTTGVILKLDNISYNDEIQVNLPLVKAPSPPPVHAVGNKARVHECQICHATFNSGQALGGHMRRHKPLNGAVDSSKNKKDRSGLELDLNFPPSDQEETVQPPPSVFPFDRNPPTELLLGNSTLTLY